MIKEVNGFKMAFSDQGQGRALVFVHGYPLNRRMWEPQVEALSEVCRVIAPDLRGHGDSDPVPGPYSMELFADDLAALLGVLEIRERIVLCGLSMGGYVAFAFYRKYAARLAGLALTATRAADDTPQARLGREQAIVTAQTEGVAAAAEGMLLRLMAPGRRESDPQLAARVRAIMNATSLEGMLGDLAGLKARPDSRSLLTEIDLPALVLHGEEDQIVPIQEAQAMAAALPNARFESIPAAGHLLNMEQPGAFNRYLRQFMLALPQEAKP